MVEDDDDVERGMDKQLDIELLSLSGTETWTNCNIEPELTEGRSASMKNLLEQFEDVLTDKPGLTTLDTFQLKLTSDEPVRLKPYPTPHSLTETVKRELDQML